MTYIHISIFFNNKIINGVVLVFLIGIIKCLGSIHASGKKMKFCLKIIYNYNIYKNNNILYYYKNKQWCSGNIICWYGKCFGSSPSGCKNLFCFVSLSPFRPISLKQDRSVRNLTETDEILLK
jgi:hypothetical protein